VQGDALADGRGFTCPAAWAYGSDRAKLLSMALYRTTGVLVIGLPASATDATA
jgi:hypothetical protein